MKSVLLFFTLSIVLTAPGQNVGINTNSPREALDIRGNLIVQSGYTKSNSAPTVGQTTTMVSNSILYPNPGDSIYKIYDPSGPTGNYPNSVNAEVRISGLTGSGIEIRIDSVNLGAGDSLFITDAGSNQVIIRAGAGFSQPNSLILNGIPLAINFTSNADGLNGTGFIITLRRLYSALPGKPINNVFGNGFYHDLATGATRGGRIDVYNKGSFSTAFGSSAADGNYAFAGGNAIASGAYSAAFGNSMTTNLSAFATGLSYAYANYSTALGNSTANGAYSASIGQSNTLGTYAFAAGKSSATAFNSTALGESTASGNFATALGNSSASGFLSTAFGTSNASGNDAVAIGFNSVASGNNSVAIGYRASTGGRTGSVCIGASTASPANPAVQNIYDGEFMVYADYYRFWTGTNGTSVYLTPGANAWLGTSDRNRKENFEPTDGEAVLEKLSNIELGSWNYKGQNPQQYRHYGVMSQDFYNAFGKDSHGTIGCDTLVNPLDMMGIAYSAIQALEKRTQAQENQIEQLVKQNAELREHLDNIQRRKKHR